MAMAMLGRMVQRRFAATSTTTTNRFKYPTSYREQIAAEVKRDGFAILPSV